MGVHGDQEVLPRDDVEGLFESLMDGLVHHINEHGDSLCAGLAGSMQERGILPSPYVEPPFPVLSLDDTSVALIVFRAMVQREGCRR